jgi:hypothetical protein
VFIGSSSEGLRFANAIFTELERDADPTVWDQDVFEPTRATLEQLEEVARSYDFAVLVMTPDDIRHSRGEYSKVPRDNVVAELGLFIGALGRSRVFFLKPREEPITLPTDVLGITALEYSGRTDNDRAAVRTACNTIKSRIAKADARTLMDGSAADVKFWHTVEDRQKHAKDVHALISAARRYVIITGISLTFIVRHCSSEVKDALSRGVLFGAVTPNATDESMRLYSRYTARVNEFLPTAQRMFCELFDSLNDVQRRHFALYYTDIPLTHSIGSYDGRMYVNEFCIDFSSSVCPSFSPEPASHSHRIFTSELKTILTESRCICGSGSKALLDMVEADS